MIAVTLTMAITGAYLLLWPVPIEPVAWDPGPNPGMTGPYAPNRDLAMIQHLAMGVGQGPEDVTRGADGFFYTGLQDGRIVRFNPDDGDGVETFVHTGGRPLGLQFDTRGHLMVADAFKGLLSVAPDGAVTVLADRIDGKPMRFVNDLDIAGDGTVWFSDASQRNDQHHFVMDFWECRPTGRLISYDPSSGQTTVRLTHLRFANGVAVGPNDAYVLVSETIGARITRLWLKGPMAGQHDTFLRDLPAYPDNLSYDDRGMFWIALPSSRLKLLDRLAKWPFLRTVLARVPATIGSVAGRPAYGWVLGVDIDGNVVYNLQDPSGSYGMVTSVNRFDGYLYLGSIATTSVGRVAAPPDGIMNHHR